MPANRPGLKTTFFLLAVAALAASPGCGRGPEGTGSKPRPPFFRFPGSSPEKEEFRKATQLQQEGKTDEALAVFQKLAAGSGDPELQAQSWWALAGIYEQKEDLEAGREALKKLIDQFSSSELVGAAQEKLGAINMKILFSPAPVAGAVSYEVKPGDSLFSLARRFGTTVDLIRRANRLTGDRIAAGNKLKIYTVRFGVVVSKSRHTLTLKAGEEVLKVYRVSTGSGDLTPVGTFPVVNKVVDPPWYRPGEVIPAGSPKNMLGSRWIGISKKGYGIHGTNDPATIGFSCTEGCIRMKNEDVEELFVVLPVDAEVVIVE